MKTYYITEFAVSCLNIFKQFYHSSVVEYDSKANGPIKGWRPDSNSKNNFI